MTNKKGNALAELEMVDKIMTEINGEPKVAKKAPSKKAVKAQEAAMVETAVAELEAAKVDTTPTPAVEPKVDPMAQAQAVFSVTALNADSRPTKTGKNIMQTVDLIVTHGDSGKVLVKIVDYAKVIYSVTVTNPETSAVIYKSPKSSVGDTAKMICELALITDAGVAKGLGLLMGNVRRDALARMTAQAATVVQVAE